SRKPLSCLCRLPRKKLFRRKPRKRQHLLIKTMSTVSGRPFSFLDEPRNKWGIVFAFGSATANLLQVLNKTFSAEFPVWAKIFLVYILSLETSLICYPLFACISSRYKLVGAITGVLYSSGWYGEI
ncbi:STR6L-like protein, partial [Mya arenaria]